MPYIGSDPSNRFVAPKAASVFSGDGSTTAFTLDHAVGSDEDILVSVDGVIQEPSVAYAVSNGTTLTFTAAPSSNSGNNIFVYYLFRTVGTVSHPSNNALQATTGNFTGAVTANAGVVIDNITIDGTEIDLSSGDFTLDVAGDIILDADGEDIIFKDAGTEIGRFSNSGSGNLSIKSSVSDKDMLFKGNDGGSTITALTLDMSANGDATFNGQVIVPQYVAHTGDGNTFMEFDTDIMGFTQGGVERLEMNRTGGVVRIKPGGSNVIYFDGNGQSINNELRRARLDMSSNTAAYTHINCQNTGSSNGVFIAVLNNSGTVIGSISQSGTSTLFNTSSDYRIKENVNYNFDATTELKKLKPCKFNFIGESETIEGFLAHEVSDVVPRAVNGAKDETRDIGTIKDADGNVLQENAIEARKEDGQTWEKTGTENVIQGLDQAKLVPLLVKTIQELEARITALENA